MTKVLYITANPKPIETSFGLQVGEHFIENLHRKHPDVEIERVNLYEDSIPLIDGVVLSAWEKAASGLPFNENEQAAVNRMEEILEQFISADAYVFVTPMWNLSFPPMLKAYIDNIVIARRTFEYTPEGPKGLMTNKKVLHIQSRGGIYSEGPAVEMEFTNKYLQTVLAFIGITDFEHLFVEGMNAFPDKAEAILDEAKIKAEKAADSFIKHT
ncbi:FMN-dependent NADH-azoreductase [Scopulibacillus daqui]|uniref:FMN dependent NADH:quinone oxidoreductase n=1 Tax=Scopulibacillus daqui TaxID=1469162 RepID=A0ABS2Q1S6_9BACL|nr:FMN-dependent NADH-azoreductase [Scopulibacillus daqui]MBM7646163.1 FMN-dependent NADH-azoreductase [Scopulibacillus daqui]